MERLSGHTVDAGASLSRMFGMKAGGDSSSLVPGSLASPGVDKEKEDGELVSLVFSSENECLNLLHKYVSGGSFSQEENRFWYEVCDRLHPGDRHEVLHR